MKTLILSLLALCASLLLRFTIVVQSVTTYALGRFTEAAKSIFKLPASVLRLALPVKRDEGWEERHASGYRLMRSARCV